MRKLIESNHVSLGGEVGTTEWALPYLDEDHMPMPQSCSSGPTCCSGRRTYEGLSAAYQAMQQGDHGDPDVPHAFVERMNALPKYVASTTLRERTWNVTIIPGDVASFLRRSQATIRGRHHQVRKWPAGRHADAAWPDRRVPSFWSPLSPGGVVAISSRTSTPRPPSSSSRARPSVVVSCCSSTPG